MRDFQTVQLRVAQAAAKIDAVLLTQIGEDERAQVIRAHLEAQVTRGRAALTEALDSDALLTTLAACVSNTPAAHTSDTPAASARA